MTKSERKACKNFKVFRTKIAEDLPVKDQKGKGRVFSDEERRREEELRANTAHRRL